LKGPFGRRGKGTIQRWGGKDIRRFKRKGRSPGRAKINQENKGTWRKREAISTKFGISIPRRGKGYVCRIRA